MHWPLLPSHTPGALHVRNKPPTHAGAGGVAQFTPAHGFERQWSLAQVHETSTEAYEQLPLLHVPLAT
jgi:hypothetical protein